MGFSGTEWQKYIYVNGVGGLRPVVKTDISKLEQQASAHMSEQAFAYVAGGAGKERTVRANELAFEKYGIVPRMLRDVGKRDSGISLFGQKLPSPFLLAPIGVLELVHNNGDLEVSRVASEFRIPFIFSNQASVPMEVCAEIMQDSPHWFQLYWSKSNELIASLVHRAEKCGCSAIVVTLDTTMLGWRPRDLDLGYLPFLEGKGIAQYTSDPVFQKMLDEPAEPVSQKRKVNYKTIQSLISMVNNYPGDGFLKKLKSGRPVKAVHKFAATYSNPFTTWNDLKFLRSITRLPILLKGILHAEDASNAIDAGMDGIYVSNHGGRQVDGSVSSLDALPEIAKVVNGKIPILFDSGIRGGSDAFKALALGATAVCIGRPYVYGLSIAGRQGVRDVLSNFLAEFDLTMGLSGCKNIGEITHESVIRA
jgi:lactate 2-monooxygenase